MAASMKGLDPTLKKYLRSNKLPDVYEVSTIKYWYANFNLLPFAIMLSFRTQD